MQGLSSAVSSPSFLLDSSRFAAPGRPSVLPNLDLIVAVMDIDHTPTPTIASPDASKRRWVSPAVLGMGNMRELTLLQGPSGGGICNPFEQPDCP